MKRRHRTLTITRKNGKIVTILLAPRTARAIRAVFVVVDRPGLQVVTSEHLHTICTASPQQFMQIPGI